MIITSAARTAELVAAGYENNPFVAWDNLAADAVDFDGVTGHLPGGDPENAVNGTTADFWLADVVGVDGRFYVEFAAPVAISFAAMAAHNIADLGGTAILESWDGIAPNWAIRGAATTPTNGDPIVWRIASVAAQYWRIRIYNLTAGDPLAIGVVFLGNELVIPSRFYQGFAPVITPNVVSLASNVSVGGNLMGSSIVSRGSKLSMPFTLVAPAFIRGDFKPFQTAFNEGAGFFTAWRPATYPGDLYYCWRDGDVIAPSNTGPRDYMGFTMSMRVHNGG